MNAVTAPFARIIECTEQEYKDDPCATPSLNASIAKVLCKQSPLHAWNEHPKFGNVVNADDDEEDGAEKKKDTDATRYGSVIHKLLLGKGCDIEVVDVDAYRTTAAKAQRDEAIRAGRVPIKIRKYDDLCAAAEAIKGNLALEGIDLDDDGGESEVAVEFHEQGEHGEIVCRVRMDRGNFKRGIIRELKSIRSADDDTCSKHVAQFGYDIQLITNTRAMAAMRPELEQIDMLFAFFEITPPYAVNVKRPSPVMHETGRIQWEGALLVWERCLRTNRWPAYGGRISELDPPKWHVDKVLGNWEGTDITDVGLER